MIDLLTMAFMAAFVIAGLITWLDSADWTAAEVWM